MKETVLFASEAFTCCVDMQATVMRECLDTVETVNSGLIAVWRSMLSHSAELNGRGVLSAK